MRLDYMTGRFTCETLSVKYAIDPRVIANFIRKNNWLRDLVSKGIVPPLDKLLASGDKKRYGLRGNNLAEFENELRRAYLDPNTPIEAVARMFGIAIEKLRYKAMTKGWIEMRRKIEDSILTDPRTRMEYAMSGLIDDASAYMRRMMRMEQEFPGEVMNAKDFKGALESFSDMCKSASVLLGADNQKNTDDIPRKAPSTNTPLALQMAPLKSKSA